MYEVKTGVIPSMGELTELYASVGWSAYINDPERLYRAAKASLGLYTVWEDGMLTALLRCVGDGETILYVQDILVRPEHQRRGLGRTLLERAMRDFPTVRQKVLMTDDAPETAAFYRTCALRPAGEYGCAAWCRYE